MGRFAVAACVLLGCRFGFEPVPTAGPDGTAQLDLAPANGLVAYWSFDNILATGNDASSNGNDAACNGKCPTLVSGIAGSAMLFDGTAACMAVPNMSSWSAPTFTISAWIKSPAMQGPVVVHESQSGCPSPELVATNGIGLVQLNTTDSTPHNEAWTPMAIASPASWHQIAVAWDGAAQTVWIDGVCACSEPQALGPLDHAQPFTIGCYPTGGNTFFTGELDEIRVYDRALAPDEMASLVTVSGEAAPAPQACAQACATVHP